LSIGSSAQLLELNTIVLFGNDPIVREQNKSFIDATEEHFYSYSANGGINELIDWIKLHQSKDEWWMAAGLYIHVISQPQLFIEGNHRTGALMMSFLLGQRGKPPFVLSIDNARAHFEPSTLAKDVIKQGLRSLLMVPKLKKRMAKNFKNSAHNHFILNPEELLIL
jgi:hypothetical protein